MLLPLTVEVLRDDPLAEGHMYAGDLLCAVITRNPAVWGDSAELRHELRVIVSGLVDLPPFIQQDVELFLVALQPRVRARAAAGRSVASWSSVVERLCASRMPGSRPDFERAG